jgi:adenine-specific DNA-methyltransferase
MSKAKRASRRRIPASGESRAQQSSQQNGSAKPKEGELGELAFLCKASSLGFALSLPYGQMQRYDFVVDGGSNLWRVQVLLVTNNEVTETNEKALSAKGKFPGEPEFERYGVSEAVAWPRCKWSLLGYRDDGSLLEGDYLTGRLLQEGFEENLEYFRLAFLDPAQVARGDAFQAVLPILWMIAGCIGEREDSKGSQGWFIPKHSPFAVLIKEKEFRPFREKLAERKDIRHVFLITDSEENFATMRIALGRRFKCVQLYKSYLENFRLNTQEGLA